MGITIKDDNRPQLLNDLQDAVERALEAVGMEAQGDVVKEITRQGIVDTGLLRNSITFAVSGQAPEKGSYTADKARNGKKATGSYSGTAPDDDIKAVYIGTNVEYAPYIQHGTSKYPTPRDFMKAPIKAKMGRYREIIKEEMGG